MHYSVSISTHELGGSGGTLLKENLFDLRLATSEAIFSPEMSLASQ